MRDQKERNGTKLHRLLSDTLPGHELFEVREGTVSNMGISPKQKRMHYKGEAGYMIRGMTYSNKCVCRSPCGWNMKRHSLGHVMQEATRCTLQLRSHHSHPT